MKKWLLMACLICLLGGLVYWVLWPVPKVPAADSDTNSDRPSAGSSAALPRVATVPGETPTNLSPEKPVLSPAAGSASTTARTVAPSTVPAMPPPPAAEASGPFPPEVLIENMRTTFRQYGLKFGGNPVGTNPEITRALDGDNPEQIRFLGPDGNRINEKGELVDSWGTPYFFHQLSAMQMEIRSAGPDRVMWTADDLVIK